MGNIFFAHPNFADVDFYTPVISGGSWESNLPLANVQTDVLSEVARSTDADTDNTQLHADLAVVRDVRAVVIPTHNFSRSATARVRASQQVAFSGVRLAAAATASDTSLTLECPNGSAMIRAGDSFRITGDDTLYTATSDLGLGGNRAAYSEDMSGAGWTATRLSVSANQASAPNGSQTADLLSENTDNNSHRLTYTPNNVPANQEVTASLFVKPAGRHLMLDMLSWTGAGVVIVDLSDGTVYATDSSGDATITDAGIVSLPNGWYRVWISGIMSTSPVYHIESIRAWLVDDSYGYAYQGDGESGIYVWGLQVEEGNLSTYKYSGATSAYNTASGTVNITPAVSANANDETAITALCGEYVSTAPVADSGWLEMFPVIYPFGSLPWGHPSVWDGKVSEEQRQEYPSPLLYILDNSVSARYWKIEISDANNADGYVEISRLFLARAYQPTRNFGYGLKLGVDSDTTLQQAKGGARYYDEEPQRRIVTGTISYVPDDEALVSLFDMVRRLGTHSQVFVSLDPDDSTHLRRKSFLATLSGRRDLEYTSFGRKGMAIQLEEVIG